MAVRRLASASPDGEGSIGLPSACGWVCGRTRDSAAGWASVSVAAGFCSGNTCGFLITLTSNTTVTTPAAPRAGTSQGVLHRRAKKPTLTWEPWEGSQSLPRWCAAGEAGGLPTRLVSTTLAVVAASAACSIRARRFGGGASSSGPRRAARACPKVEDMAFTSALHAAQPSTCATNSRRSSAGISS